MITWILSLDEKLFLLINVGMANPVLDAAFPYITRFKYWVVPLAVCLILYYRKEGRKGLLIAFLAALLVGISDPLCVRVLKPLFGRLRPCDPAGLVEGARFLSGNLKSFSFPSAHAMNFFAVSAFFSLLYRRYWLIFFCLAGLVGFTRIYLGVHYPLDVAGGALMGFALGSAYGRIILRFFSPWILTTNEASQGNRSH